MWLTVFQGCLVLSVSGIAETAIAERTKDKHTIVYIKTKDITTSKDLHGFCSEMFADLALTKDRSSIRAQRCRLHYE